MVLKENPVDVVLCEDLAGLGGEWVLDDFINRLEGSLEQVKVRIEPDLCHRPGSVADLVSNGDEGRLVLGLCNRIPAAYEFQGWARKAGLDPFAMDLVDLGPRASSKGLENLDAALLQIEAVIARLRAFVGSDPEQLKMRLLYDQRKMSRRSLVSLPPWTYEAVPSIDIAKCLGPEQCGICKQACPFSAIKEDSGSLYVEKVKCEACGLCQAACPADAVDFPGSSLRQYEAQLKALLESGCENIAFYCKQGGQSLDGAGEGGVELAAGWQLVEVPCMGSVTPGWLLQTLAAGAASVALLGCAERCSSGSGDLVNKRVSYLQELLKLIGVDHPQERVVMESTESVDKKISLAKTPSLEVVCPGGKTTDFVLNEPLATTRAVIKLSESVGTNSDIALENEASPLGVVHINEDSCTVCGACASNCPTGALSISEEDTVILRWDAIACIGCGRCVPVCPEKEKQAITVTKSTDVAALLNGRVKVIDAKMARCKRCGRPIAPAAMMTAIQSKLKEDQNEQLRKAVGELCADCRWLDASPV